MQWNQGQVMTENTFKRVLSQHPKCDRCGRDSHRQPTECQQKEIFVTIWEKKITALMLQTKTWNALSCSNFPSREKSKSGETGSTVTYFLGSVEKQETLVHSFHDEWAKVPIQNRHWSWCIHNLTQSVQQTRAKTTLNRTRAVLKSPGVMKCHDQFVTHVRQENDCKYAVRLFVVDADTENLVRRSEASDHNLVKRVQNINDINSTPSVFGDLNDKPLQCKAKRRRRSIQLISS